MEKKLYKSRYGNKIDGVCKGLAEYFEIDPTIVRVGWVMFFLIAFPAAILGYLACSILVPREPYSV